MGPISFWGNVVPRAFERIGGTILGAALGLVALQLEGWSLPLMLLWCALAMFLCGFLALGKRPYQALLIGITLSVVVGAPQGDMLVALWRGGDVIFGSLLAMLFTSLWPQRAFIHWRIQMANFVGDFAKIYHAGLSPNLVERPRLDKPLQNILGSVVKLRAFITPASKETHIQRAIFEAIQTTSRNMVCTLEMQNNARWASRESHFLMINARTLRDSQQMTENTLAAIAIGAARRKPVAGDGQPREARGDRPELRALMSEGQQGALVETPIHGYVWLSMELAQQLERLSQLICRALRK